MIYNWLERARWISLPQSLMPALTALILAVGMPDFSPALGMLAVFGGCMAHLSFNLFDDYFDYQSHQSGYRETLVRAGVRARTGKCDYLVSGEATTKQLLLACCMFGVLAVVPGAVILAVRGLPVLGIVAVTAFLGIFYSGKPLRLSYHGLGEPVIGVIFGPLLMTGVYYSACGILDLPIALVGLCIGLLVLNILYTHSVLDLEADLSVGKRTLAALIPSKMGRLFGTGCFCFLPYVLILAGVLSGTLTAVYLLAFLSLPLAAALFNSMWDFLTDARATVERKIWFGPMPHWDNVREAGLDWFLLRWLLARNLLTAFSLLCIIASILSKVVSIR